MQQTFAQKISSRFRPSKWIPKQPAPPTEAFSINFLRRQHLPVSVRRIIVRLALVYLAINIVILGGIFIASWTVKISRNHLAEELNKKIPQTLQIETLENEMKGLKSEISQNLSGMHSAIGLQNSRFPVTAKLAAIAETLPARTWIRKLEASQSERSIHIEALYLMDSKHPYEYPTKEWIDALRETPAFAKDLESLELKKTSRKSQGQSDIYAFELEGVWRSEEEKS